MDSSSRAADELSWAVRTFIYASIADSGQPPSVAEAAAALDLTEEAARNAFVWLHERPGAARGEALTLAQTWELSRRWYGDRMRPDFHGRTPEQARAIFRELGLTSPFWAP